MKLVSVNQKWFITGRDGQDDETLYPIIKVLNNVLNQGLSSIKYVVSPSFDNGNIFTVLNMKGDGFEDNFTFRMIELPDRETDPFVVIYNITTPSLAEKFHEYLITFLPAAKVVLSSERFLPESTIQRLISMF